MQEGVELPLRGSGLFVSETGVATNHHFRLAYKPEYKNSTPMIEPGEYKIKIFADVFKGASKICLFNTTLDVSVEDVESIAAREKCYAEKLVGLYYDYSPSSQIKIEGQKKGFLENLTGRLKIFFTIKRTVRPLSVPVRIQYLKNVDTSPVKSVDWFESKR